jgi:hypothetical protein
MPRPLRDGVDEALREQVAGRDARRRTARGRRAWVYNGEVLSIK